MRQPSDNPQRFRIEVRSSFWKYETTLAKFSEVPDRGQKLFWEFSDNPSNLKQISETTLKILKRSFEILKGSFEILRGSFGILRGSGSWSEVPDPILKRSFEILRGSGSCQRFRIRFSNALLKFSEVPDPVRGSGSGSQTTYLKLTNAQPSPAMPI